MSSSYWRFELRCKFDETVFIWPPEESQPLCGDSSDEALMSEVIICPGDPEELIASHIELVDSRQKKLEIRDCFDILHATEEEAPQ